MPNGIKNTTYNDKTGACHFWPKSDRHPHYSMRQFFKYLSKISDFVSTHFPEKHDYWGRLIILNPLDFKSSICWSIVLNTFSPIIKCPINKKPPSVRAFLQRPEGIVNYNIPFPPVIVNNIKLVFLTIIGIFFGFSSM